MHIQKKNVPLLIILLLVSTIFLSCSKEYKFKKSLENAKNNILKSEDYLNKLSSEDRKINNFQKIRKEYNNIIDVADADYLKAFELNQTINFSYQTAMSYFNTTNKYLDQKYCLNWLVRCKQSTNYTPRFFIQLLKNSTDIKKRYFLINAMGLMHDKNYIDALHHIITNRTIGADLSVKKQTDISYALTALGEIGDQSSTVILLNIYTNKNDLFGYRLFAGEALSRITGKKFDLEPGAFINKNHI